MKCCGINGPQDWEQVFQNNTIPLWCCQDHDVNNTNICHVYYQDGCLPKLLNELKSNSMVITISGITIAMIQV